MLTVPLAAGGWLAYQAMGGRVPAEVREIPGPHIHGLAVDPFEPEAVWVGAHGGLLRLRKGRWERVGAHTYDLMGFLVHPRQPGVLLTSGHPGPRDRRPNPLGVEVSRDGGLTWQPLALAGEADFHAMAQSPSDPNVLYGWNVTGRTGLYRSLDGGRRWTYLGEQGLDRLFFLTVHPRDPRLVYAGTIQGLLVSPNGGESWQPTAGPLARVPVTALAFHPGDPQWAYAYAAASGLGLLRSSDGGRTWSSLGLFLGEQDAVGHLALDPSDPKVLYLSTFSADLYRSVDGGKTLRTLVSRGRVLAP
ncbi:hypothetical protein HRbin32_00940 [bacterium HR32]|nr:hypothetical protein HRbin32_00940 [bacterium HR32]